MRRDKSSSLIECGVMIVIGLIIYSAWIAGQMRRTAIANAQHDVVVHH